MKGSFRIGGWMGGLVVRFFFSEGGRGGPFTIWSGSYAKI